MFQEHRLFIALDLPDEICGEVVRIQVDLKHVLDESILKWSRVQGIHLTLKFLGTVKEESISSIQDCMTKVAKQQKHIQIQLRELGIFPNVKRPKVLWCGILSKSDGLLNLQTRLDAELGKWGFPKETRTFVPHLTIGRFRGVINKNNHFLNVFQGILEKGSKSCGQFVSARSISLIKSQLHHTGSIYTSLFTFPF